MVTRGSLAPVPLPSWVPADETKPAPLPLLIVQAFVNTREADTATDLLADPVTARAWLHDAGLWADDQPDPRDDELRRARQVRESIRALIAANGTASPADPVDLAPLEELTRSARARITVGVDGRIDLVPEPSDRLNGPLGQLLLVIRDAQHDGTWARLKTCDNRDCSWAFYDRSHTRRGRWCDMAVCGNRIKNRNLRERRR